MASSRLPEREVREESKRVATANPDFSPHKFSLLIITGRSAPLTQTAPINREIERGTLVSTPYAAVAVLPPLLLYTRIKYSDACKPSSNDSSSTMLHWARCSACVIWFTPLIEDASSGNSPPSASPHPSGRIRINSSEQRGGVRLFASVTLCRCVYGEALGGMMQCELALVKDEP